MINDHHHCFAPNLPPSLFFLVFERCSDVTQEGATQEYVVFKGCVSSKAMAMSPTKQLAEDLEQALRDLESKEDLLMITKRDNERLRSLLRETREEFHGQVEKFAGEKASSEARLMEAKLEAEREKSNRRDVQRELEEAVGERERHIRTVADARRQVDSKLTRLVDDLRSKDAALQDLQFKVAGIEKEKERLSSFEGLYRSREEQLHTVMQEYSSLQSDHTKVCSINTQLEAELESLRMVRERELSVPPPLPPPPQPASPTHNQRQVVVEQSGHVLPSQIGFAKDVKKDLSQFSDTAESLYDDLSDLKTILSRGTSGSVDLIGAQSHDRQRIASMRRMQHSLSLSQPPHGSGSDDVEELRALMAATRDSQARVHLTLSGITDFAKELKSFVERNCSVYGGLETMHSIVMSGGGGGGERTTPTRPQPWPSQHDSTELAEGHQHLPPISTSAGHQFPHSQQGSGSAAITQMNEALMAKEKDITGLRLKLQEAVHRADMAEAAVKRLEGSSERLQAELDQSRNREAEEIKRNRELQLELQEVMSKARDEREEHLNTMAANGRKHEDNLRSQQREFDIKLRETDQKHDSELRQLNAKADNALQENADLSQQQSRFGQELEKNKERLSSVKRQRDDLDTEVKELRQRLLDAAKEVRHYQESAEAMASQLDCYQSVEQFERQQKETALVEDFDDDVWTDWKANRKQQQHMHSAAAAAAPTIATGRKGPTAGAAAARGGGGGSHSISSITPIKFVRGPAAATNKTRGGSRGAAGGSGGAWH